MKSRNACAWLVTILTIGVGVTMPAAAQDEGSQCTRARAAGKWAFTDSGTVVGVGPRKAVGIFTLDMAGNVLNGAATSSLNGSIANETFSGTYTVNSDCTGTISVEIFESGAEIFAIKVNLAFGDGMNEMRGLFTAVVAPNGSSLSTVIALDGRKQ